MSEGATDLEAWLGDQPTALAATLLAIARGCRRIAELAGLVGLDPADADEAHAARRLVTEAERALAAPLAACPHVAGWANQEASRASSDHAEQGRHLVLYAPLGGATDVASNLAVGTVFSVLPHPFRGTPPGAAGFLQPGRRQLACGYAMYGPATLLVLSCGAGVAVFTLDWRDARWRLSRAAVSLPRTTRDFAINASNQRFWDKPVQRYVAECLAGSEGPRGRDFNMLWLGSPVAATHRILTRGGVFLHPREARGAHSAGRVRLLTEAAPLAYLIEQAGGAAVTGTQAVLDVVPDTLAQRVPLILGARDEVELIVRYHADPSENVGWQLFRTRSLFVQASG
jgi:fructose-1,6-bisphosphatase